MLWIVLTVWLYITGAGVTRNLIAYRMRFDPHEDDGSWPDEIGRQVVIVLWPVIFSWLLLAGWWITGDPKYSDNEEES